MTADKQSDSKVAETKAEFKSTGNSPPPKQSPEDAATEAAYKAAVAELDLKRERDNARVNLKRVRALNDLEDDLLKREASINAKMAPLEVAQARLGVNYAADKSNAETALETASTDYDDKKKDHDEAKLALSEAKDVLTALERERKAAEKLNATTNIADDIALLETERHLNKGVNDKAKASVEADAKAANAMTEAWYKEELAKLNDDFNKTQ